MDTKRFVTATTLLFSSYTLIAPARADLLSLSSESIRIDTGRAGNVPLSSPTILKESGDSTAKIIGVFPS